MINHIVQINAMVGHDSFTKRLLKLLSYQTEKAVKAHHVKRPTILRNYIYDTIIDSIEHVTQ